MLILGAEGTTDVTEKTPATDTKAEVTETAPAPKAEEPVKEATASEGNAQDILQMIRASQNG